VPLLTLNLQLSLWGSLLAGAQVLGARSAADAGTGARAPLLGFGGYAWSVVGLQALGGLVVSVVIKHTDNIVKGFAMALSILLSWALSIPIFGLEPSPIFTLGLVLVVGSVVLFSAGETGEATAVALLAGGGEGGSKRRRSWLDGRDAAWMNVSALCAGVATGILGALVWLTYE
jgi:UDP-sugar transporter A1/2/3